MEKARDTITFRISDFGIQPNTSEDACEAMRRILRAAAEVDEHVVIQFEGGSYNFYHTHASKEVYFVSNTASELENPDNTKSIGIHLKQMSNITIDGGGALLIFHGKMTPIIIDGCQNIEIKHVSVDFERPTMSEMRVEAIHDTSMDCAIHQDSWYCIEREKLVWIGEGWRYSSGPSQEFDPDSNRTWRTWNPASEAIRVEELEPFKVRFHYKKPPETTLGHIFQMRDGIRDQTGTFIVQSKNIVFDQVNFGYMHGLGVVAQFSENITLQQITCEPRRGTGRTAAAFADFVHVSGCKGKVGIYNSKFSGSHDDVINVHGTHLKIMEMVGDKACVVRFMHHQTYGFDAFYPGDHVDFIHRSTLTAIGSCTIQKAKQVNSREIWLEFTERIPDDVCLGDVIENVSWNPQVEVIGNDFSSVPTRGILVSTRQKVVIQKNTFDGMQMSGILIADDGESWFESGMVRDVTISHNNFIKCGDPVISVMPENEEAHYKDPVHRNITIEHNFFYLDGTGLVDAKSTQGLVIRGNVVAGTSHAGKPLMILEACSDVLIEDNNFPTENHRMHITNMPVEAVTMDPLRPLILETATNE
ncbi:Alpha-1,3-galactosidase A [Paenibacillus allorhizoplanae]|uniref:Alpha-1,3-galactosidase A n=1 Tax=Paenibacillus allorhizoplanae TaxID=2905648 RepID=A0ABN8FZ15_9BACL|nr:right-handed parallel beta-helix repeat-containing protein [Paenibacillus allorhizoplanae]CAH1192981.1 Alpha-1,3-galactosidase A [Paenibacillus allorhizoplanae]